MDQTLHQVSSYLDVTRFLRAVGRRAASPRLTRAGVTAVGPFAVNAARPDSPSSMATNAIAVSRLGLLDGIVNPHSTGLAWITTLGWLEAVPRPGMVTLDG